MCNCLKKMQCCLTLHGRENCSSSRQPWILKTLDLPNLSLMPISAMYINGGKTIFTIILMCKGPKLESEALYLYSCNKCCLFTARGVKGAITKRGINLNEKWTAVWEKNVRTLTTKESQMPMMKMKFGKSPRKFRILEMNQHGNLKLTMELQMTTR